MISVTPPLPLQCAVARCNGSVTDVCACAGAGAGGVGRLRCVRTSITRFANGGWPERQWTRHVGAKTPVPGGRVEMSASVPV